MLQYRTPKLVLVGLDFLDFRVDPESRTNFDSTRDRSFGRFRERVSALLTIGALADSLATLKAQYDPYPTSLTEAGFNPMRDYVGIARREGYYAMFRQRDLENANAYVRGSKDVYLARRKTCALSFTPSSG